jgi:hypothetical protein
VKNWQLKSWSGGNLDGYMCVHGSYSLGSELKSWFERGKNGTISPKPGQQFHSLTIGMIGF